MQRGNALILLYEQNRRRSRGKKGRERKAKGRKGVQLFNPHLLLYNLTATP